MLLPCAQNGGTEIRWKRAWRCLMFPPRSLSSHGEALRAQKSLANAGAAAALTLETAGAPRSSAWRPRRRKHRSRGPRKAANEPLWLGKTITAEPTTQESGPCLPRDWPAWGWNSLSWPLPRWGCSAASLRSLRRRRSRPQAASSKCRLRRRLVPRPATGAPAT